MVCDISVVLPSLNQYCVVQIELLEELSYHCGNLSISNTRLQRACRTLEVNEALRGLK